MWFFWPRSAGGDRSSVNLRAVLFFLSRWLISTLRGRIHMASAREASGRLLDPALHDNRGHRSAVCSTGQKAPSLGNVFSGVARDSHANFVCVILSDILVLTPYLKA